MEQENFPTPESSKSVFLIEVEKIRPNPMQPRADFDQAGLNGLAESIRQYGVLQPLVVVRKEEDTPSGTSVYYELIAGERRLRAARLAGLFQVPVIIRKEPAEKVKLEIALIENIQREDLNAVERARAFKQLSNDFKLKHRDIALKIGKSREYVTNTIRILDLPDEMQKAITSGKMNEGYFKPLLMLSSRPEHQKTLFYDILNKDIKMREAELIARRIAVERARKRDDLPDEEGRQIEQKLGEVLGARVAITRKRHGGVIAIAFFSEDELRQILERMIKEKEIAEPSVAASEEAPASPNRGESLVPEGRESPPAEFLPAEPEPPQEPDLKISII
ncbi:MAG: ParB-like protein partition protein [Parcubacteria group bacterium GW2011_GWA2_42_35]|nr:MAG: ParB-like protein partition protein [Parcubacteria group bacterium GW2011_GWC2_42_13]KKS58179.1 MAG: ParB-like protein partition protein [Parcubacteria group bacterium GW2011_GWA2_42_35]